MARKIKRIVGLPQMPRAGRDPRNSFDPKNPRDKFLIDQKRALYDHQYALEQLIEENNTGGTGGHIIQDEGVDLPPEARLNFIGAAVTVTDNIGTGATDVTITPGTQNLFETIAVAGQSDVVADTTTDTLTLIAGAGIAISTNAGADSVTITAIGGVGQTGPQGPPGPPGDEGEPGELGPQGPPGVTTTQVREITTPGSGTVQVPVGVSAMWVTMVGAGSGGQNGGATAGGGGGAAGEQVSGMLVAVPDGGTVAYTVGTGGTAGADGTATVFGDFIALPGLAGLTAGKGGAGGGVSGGVGGGASNPGVAGAMGLASATLWFCGSGGGGSGSGANLNGGNGGGAGGRIRGGVGGTGGGGFGGGGGGASSIYGIGGAAGNGNVAGTAAASTAYGAGGGGGGGNAKAGGGGGNGYLMLSFIASS